jgi:hypothetical protein
MPIPSFENSSKSKKHLRFFANPKRACESFSDMEKRAVLFTESPTTQDLIDAIHHNNTILIEDINLKDGLAGFEAPPGDLALSLTTLTAYLIDITAVIDHFLLHRTTLHPVLCEQILTSTHEVVTNALLWSNLEVDYPNKRQKCLNFGDSIKKQLKNNKLAQRLLKINFHLAPESVDVVIMSAGKEFDWCHAISNISSDVQGLAIIHSFADDVIAENNGKALRLRFYI